MCTLVFVLVLVGYAGFAFLQLTGLSPEAGLSVSKITKPYNVDATQPFPASEDEKEKNQIAFGLVKRDSPGSVLDPFVGTMQPYLRWRDENEKITQVPLLTHPCTRTELGLDESDTSTSLMYRPSEEDSKKVLEKFAS